MDVEAGLPRKKRGAQAGNTNAVKHGFYSRCFRCEELADINQLSGEDLQGDITMLRVLMRRLFELVSSETPDLETLSKVLAVFGRGASQLGTLLRAKKDLAVERTDVAAALSKAISGVLEELER
jgi:hypothetical protein